MNTSYHIHIDIIKFIFNSIHIQTHIQFDIEFEINIFIP